MISLDRASYQVQPRYAEYVGLSTDVKPVEVDNGDEFQEIDTRFVYKFNAETSEWVKQPTGGGGGGGTDNYNDLINKPQINGVTLTGNKTTEQLGIDIPIKLPNPFALTFTGGATGAYDGSQAVSVEIPEPGGTNDYNDLINKPQINGVELIGNKTSAELGLGEDNWELLYEHVVTEEENDIDVWGVSQDQEGNPLSLKKGALLVEDIAVDVTGKKCLFQMTSNSTGNQNYIVSTSGTGVTANTNNSFLIIAYGENLNEYVSWKAAAKINPGLLGEPLNWYWTNGIDTGTNDSTWKYPANGVHWQLHGALFQAGTKFTVWGVKA